MGRSFSHFSFSQPIFLENVLLLLVSCHNGWSFFAYGLFFFFAFSLSFLAFSPNFILPCSALDVYTICIFDSFVLKFSFFVHLFCFYCCCFQFFFIPNSCRQRQKNQLCAYKKPVPMFNFWLCDLHVQLFRSSINWKWHYYSVQHGVGYFNVCFFLLLFYASLKRDILVLPGCSVSFDQIIYFQCKIYFIGYGGYKTLAFNWLCKGNSPETDWTKSDFTSEMCFFVLCRHKTHYFFN